MHIVREMFISLSTSQHQGNARSGATGKASEGMLFNDAGRPTRPGFPFLEIRPPVSRRVPTSLPPFNSAPLMRFPFFAAKIFGGA